MIAVAAVYVWRQFRRRSYAMKFTNVDLLRTLAPRGLGWRRHAAAGAFLLSLVALGTAMARPSVDREQPLERATVMLAKRVPAGQGLSYGHTYVTSRATTVAVIPLGYADGVPRAASSRVRCE